MHDAAYCSICLPYSCARGTRIGGGYVKVLYARRSHRRGVWYLQGNQQGARRIGICPMQAARRASCGGGVNNIASFTMQVYRYVYRIASIFCCVYNLFTCHTTIFVVIQPFRLPRSDQIAAPLAVPLAVPHMRAHNSIIEERIMHFSNFIHCLCPFLQVYAIMQ